MVIPRTKLANGQHRAFSLIELVLVLAILGVMAAIAVPKYAASLASYRAELAARKLVADLALARAEAQAKSASRTVRFSVAADTCTLLGVADPDHGTVPYVINLREEPFRVRLTSAVFDDLASAVDPLDEVTFDGFGMPDSGGTLTIVAGSAGRTVALDPETGEAQVQ